MKKAIYIILGMTLGIFLLLLVSCSTQNTQETQNSYDSGYQIGYNSGYRIGFREGAQAGFNAGRFPLIPGEYKTFSDWFYSTFPQYR